MQTVKFDPKKEMPIMETFFSLQGEGYYAGRPAYFIRLAGCDIGCVWCDVKESWEVNNTQIKTIKSIVNKCVTSKANFVVITGGEPAIYDISYLVSSLKSNNMQVAIETSGAYKVTSNIDWYCFSPKKFKSPCPEAYKKANELKVIVFNKSDLKWAEDHASKVSNNCLLYLQAEWSKKEKVTPLIIDYLKNNNKWKLSLQTHKYIDIP